MKLKLPKLKSFKQKFGKLSRKQKIVALVFGGVVISSAVFVVAELGGYGTNGPATAPNSLNEGLIGYWDFEEGVGQTINDKSGKGNDGFVGWDATEGENDPIFVPGHDSSGPNGTGLGFDGANDYVYLGDGDGLNVTTGFSAGAWVQPISARYDNEIIARVKGTPNQGFGLYYGSGSYYLYLTTENTAWTGVYSTENAVTLGSWQHIFVTYDNINTAKVYIDGVLVVTNTTTWSGKILNGSSADAFIGMSGWGNGVGEKMIDEVRLYDRAITDDEVRLLYNQKKPVLEMKFDEGSGTVAHDESFNHSDGTLGGDGVGTDLPTWTTGVSGSALSFDGADDYVDATGAINVDEFTVSFFLEDLGTTTEWAGYVTLSTAGANYISVLINGYNMAQVIPVVRIDGVNYDAPSVSLDAGLNHYSAVFSKSGGYRKTFVNGVLMGTSDYWPGGMVLTDITVGAYTKSVIDGFRIYNYARTADEVLADYNDGLAAHMGKNNQDLDYGLVGHWDMEEGGGQTIKDKSGNGNDATLGSSSSVDSADPVFGPGHDSSGENGTGMAFDGMDDYASIPDSSSLGYADPVISWSSWIKLPSSPALSTGAVLSRYYDGFSTQILTTRKVRTEVYINSGTEFSFQSKAVLSTDVWYNLTTTFDGDTLRSYINGVLDNSLSGAAATTFYRYANVWRVGSKIGGTNYFSGSIDEVRIYNRTLSEDEVRQLYNQKKPVLEMNLDEGSGTVTHDESFNNNDGTLGGDGAGTDLPTWTTGANGGALLFDGTDDYVDISSAIPTYSLAAYSISMWAKGASGQTDMRLFSQGSSTNSLPLFTIGTDQSGTTGKIDVFFRDENNNTYLNHVKSDGVAFDNTWHHVMWTDIAGSAKIYIDGVSSGSFTYTPPASVFAYDRAALGAVYRSALSNFFTGSIDSVRIYNYVRTKDEVITDYNDGLAAHLGKNNQDLNHGLVGYWDMEEGGGQTIYDKSDNGNNGILGSSSSVDSADPVFGSGHDSSGENGTGMVFDGMDDYVVVSDSNTLDITEELTLSAWVKRDETAVYDGIVLKNNSYLLAINNGDHVYFNYHNGTGWIGESYSDTLISSSTWHHIAASYKKDRGTVQVFVDGVMDKETAVTANSIVTNSNPFSIGHCLGWGDTWFTDGSIDEVRIYNRALSEDEIRQLYNQKKPVLEMKFDEGSGTMAYDESFNNNDGTLGGDGLGTDLPIWAQGKFGGALSFDGTDDYASLSSTNILGSKWTVGAWVYPANNNVRKFFFSQGYAYFDLNASGKFYGYVPTNGTTLNMLSNSTYIANQWYYVSYTFDGALGSLYINGRLDKTAVASGTANTGTTRIGQYGANGFFWNGLIDNLNVYNYARSAGEVLVDYNNGLAAHLR